MLGGQKVQTLFDLRRVWLTMTDIGPVLNFLNCRTPAAWLDHAVRDLDALLLDHASLELKAAQQAQRLIWKYAASQSNAGAGLSDGFRSKLMNKMSRLAREELRHFEQVVALLEDRGTVYSAVSASRYASGLHELARKQEPGALIDILIIGAIIEARSCERFFSLQSLLETADQKLGKFYSSLLQSEARHFEDYLQLAEELADSNLTDRIDELLQRDAELIQAPDAQLRFHSGAPPEAAGE